MDNPVTGIDHTYLLIDNLDQGARKFESLGFTLSPRGYHSAEKGTANHTIMFPHDYIELLGIVSQTSESDVLQQDLQKRGEGIRAVVGRIGDARQAAAALKELGIETLPVSDFERPIPLPGGKQGSAAFSVTHFAPKEIPFGTLFLCQHHTPENVWLPELLTHPNTAVGMSAIIGVTERIDEDSAGFSRLWKNAKITKSDHQVRITTGQNSAHIILQNKEQLKSMYNFIDISKIMDRTFASIVIAVKSLDEASRVIRSSGTVAHETARGLAVAPGDACGAILEFVPA